MPENDRRLCSSLRSSRTLSKQRANFREINFAQLSPRIELSRLSREEGSEKDEKKDNEYLSPPSSTSFSSLLNSYFSTNGMRRSNKFSK